MFGVGNILVSLGQTRRSESIVNDTKEPPVSMPTARTKAIESLTSFRPGKFVHRSIVLSAIELSKTRPFRRQRWIPSMERSFCTKSD